MAKKQDPVIGWEDSYVTSFRIPYGVWQSARLKAMVEGVHLSDVIEQFLRSWTDEEYVALARRRSDAAQKLKEEQDAELDAALPGRAVRTRTE